MIRVFVAVLVSFIASFAHAMPDIQTLKTPAGTPAWLVEDHNIPFVALELRFVGGTAIEPMEKRGVTQFMMGLLEEGSGDMERPRCTSAAWLIVASPPSPFFCASFSF